MLKVFLSWSLKGGEEGEEKDIREEMVETRTCPEAEAEAGGRRDEVVLRGRIRRKTGKRMSGRTKI